VPKEILVPDGVPKPAAPYATAVRVKAAGSFLFLAGVVSCDVEGALLFPGDILAQTRQMVKNVIAILEAAGASPRDVVKATTYVANDAMEDFFATGASLECLQAFDHPADTLVGVAGLARSSQGQLIEIDIVAATD
jgi:2-iminobutanoate/2-iminopropanoate deaminase